MKHHQVLLWLGLCWFCWSGCSHLPENLTLRSDVALTETAHYISLLPKATPVAETGLLFYPGGLVAPRAYVPALQALVAAGYPVVILKVNGNVAISNVGKAIQYQGVVPAVRRWVLGGHSLGGIVACRDVQLAPDAYAGLVLLASYPQEVRRVDDWDGAVLSIWAEFDGLITEDEIEENKVFLPTAQVLSDLNQFPTQPTGGTTLYYEIKGGNHAQFGDYGTQQGDLDATISREAQQTLVTDALFRFFNANQWQ